MEDTSFQLTGKVRLHSSSSSYYEYALNNPDSSSFYYVVAGALTKLSGGNVNESHDFPSRLSGSHSDSMLSLPKGWRNLIGGEQDEKIHYVGMFLDSKYVNTMLPHQFKRYRIQQSILLVW